MKKINNDGRSQLFWLEFVMMAGVLLLIVVMTLVGVQSAYKANINNQIKMETSIELQNIMEYCKINRTDIETSIQLLGGELREASEHYSRLLLYYDEDWKQVVPIQEAAYGIELQIQTTEHTYGQLREIVLEGYEIEHYNDMQHGTKGNGKSLILTLEGSCIIGEGEI